MSHPPDPLLAPLVIDLPPVERAARMPGGFSAVGTTAGIKVSGRQDFALIVADGGPVPAAAVFTPNRFAAAPVQLSRANLRATGGSELAAGYAHAVIATSGSANAATGPAGDADQAAIGAAVAAALGIDPNQVLHLSTGVIGTRLPVDKVTATIARVAAGGLAATDDALASAALSLRTTDSTTKMASVRVALPAAGGGAPVAVTVSGICKGVGMIHPRMATMLAVILTNASASPATLHALLSPIVQRTWNQLTVDGDTSTNDTVFLLASGAAAARPVTATGPEAEALAGAIEAVARSLARAQAADGEGASTLITCQVSGAADDADARAVARSVVGSSLLKAAIHGRDPNWGRVASAAGNTRLPDEALLEAAGVLHSEAAARAGRPPKLDVDRLRIAIAGTLVFAGAPLEFDREAVRGTMEAPEVLIRLDMGLGDGSGEAFGCDLTEGYVIENAEYTT